jgi:hypothetical protein
MMHYSNNEITLLLKSVACYEADINISIKEYRKSLGYEFDSEYEQELLEECAELATLRTKLEATLSARRI